MNSIIKTFNLLTGRTSRYNRTLRLVRDWAAKVQEVLTTYELIDSTDFKKLLQDTGDAKFDLTSISYKGRPLINKANVIKDRDISRLVADIVDETDSIRRYLMNPSLQIDRLGKGVRNLCVSFKFLRDELSRTEYM
jgi:hypothetical protein